jgi:hypothetical protein
VLVAADWARPAFDLEQMRQLRFPLPDGNVKKKEAVAAATGALRKDLAALVKVGAIAALDRARAGR